MIGGGGGGGGGCECGYGRGCGRGRGRRGGGRVGEAFKVRMEVRAYEDGRDKASVRGAQTIYSLELIGQRRELRKAANSGGRCRGTSAGYVG